MTEPALMQIFEVESWIVGMAMMATGVLKLLWGLDLVITEIPSGRVRFLRSGAFWLGQYFVLRSISVDLLLAMVLLAEPDETITAWFAIPIIVSSVEAGLAWYYLSRKG